MIIDLYSYLPICKNKTVTQAAMTMSPDGDRFCCDVDLWVLHQISRRTGGYLHHILALQLEREVACSCPCNNHVNSLRGATGEISNFYNLSARLLIVNIHIPPIINTHTSKFRSSLSDTFWIMIFLFFEKGPIFEIYLLGKI